MDSRCLTTLITHPLPPLRSPFPPQYLRYSSSSVRVVANKQSDDKFSLEKPHLQEEKRVSIGFYMSESRRNRFNFLHRNRN